MAKKSPLKKKRQAGPYVIAALFCENILLDTDGTVSAIRVYDKAVVHIAEDFKVGKDSAQPPQPIKFFFAVRPGESKGMHRLELFWKQPSGQRSSMLKHDLMLVGGENGSNLRNSLLPLLKSEGLYWVEAEIDGKILSRTPLRVEFAKPASSAKSSDQ